MDLMELLPEYYRGNLTMQQLQGILSTDITAMVSNFGETIDECFINTASALLSRYEQIYGVRANSSKTDRFRRERIKAKIRGTGTTTKQMIQDTAASYTNGEVEVIEDNANYSFVIKFTGSLGIPGNMADLILTIEEIKPAHLTFTFEYVYRAYDQLAEYTHDYLDAFTYNQLREGALT